MREVAIIYKTLRRNLLISLKLLVESQALWKQGIDEIRAGGAVIWGQPGVLA